MGKARAFNSLGQILSAGGDLMLARMLAAGAPTALIWGRASQLFRLPSDTSVQRLVDLAGHEYQAGIDMSAASDRNILIAKELPINPYLFGEEPGGNRTLIGIDYLDKESGDAIHRRIVDDGTHTLAEQIEADAEKLAENVPKYPTLLDVLKYTDPEAYGIAILYGVRRF